LPTVTVYNHLDVQPASKETEPWETEPFRLHEAGGPLLRPRRHGRQGARPDGALRHQGGDGGEAPREPPGPLEFEEEIGSPSFHKGISAAAAQLATDSVIVSDTIWIARGKPAAPAGLRGLQGFTFSLETGTTDQHSA